MEGFLVMSHRPGLSIFSLVLLGLSSGEGTLLAQTPAPQSDEAIVRVVKSKLLRIRQSDVAAAAKILNEAVRDHPDIFELRDLRYSKFKFFDANHHTDYFTPEFRLAESRAMLEMVPADSHLRGPVHTSRAVVLEELGGKGEYEAFVRWWKTAEPGPEPKMRMARIHMCRGDYEAALREIEDLDPVPDRAARLRTLLSPAADLKGHLERARLWLEMGTEHDAVSRAERPPPGERPSPKQIADFDAAAKEFEAAIALHPESALLRVWRAGARFAAGRMKMARADLDVALEIHPSCSEALICRGHLFRAHLRFDEALNDYGRAIAINPEHGEPYLGRALVHYFRGDLDAAYDNAFVGRVLKNRTENGWLAKLPVAKPTELLLPSRWPLAVPVPEGLAPHESLLENVPAAHRDTFRTAAIHLAGGNPDETVALLADIPATEQFGNELRRVTGLAHLFAGHATDGLSEIFSPKVRKEGGLIFGMERRWSERRPVENFFLPALRSRYEKGYYLEDIEAGMGKASASGSILPRLDGERVSKAGFLAAAREEALTAYEDSKRFQTAPSYRFGDALHAGEAEAIRKRLALRYESAVRSVALWDFEKAGAYFRELLESEALSPFLRRNALREFNEQSVTDFVSNASSPSRPAGEEMRRSWKKVLESDLLDPERGGRAEARIRERMQVGAANHMARYSGTTKFDAEVSEKLLSDARAILGEARKETVDEAQLDIAIRVEVIQALETIQGTWARLDRTSPELASLTLLRPDSPVVEDLEGRIARNSEPGDRKAANARSFLALGKAMAAEGMLEEAQRKLSDAARLDQTLGREVVEAIIAIRQQQQRQRQGQ